MFQAPALVVDSISPPLAVFHTPAPLVEVISPALAVFRSAAPVLENISLAPQYLKRQRQLWSTSCRFASDGLPHRGTALPLACGPIWVASSWVKTLPGNLGGHCFIVVRAPLAAAGRSSLRVALLHYGQSPLLWPLESNGLCSCVREGRPGCCRSYLVVTVLVRPLPKTEIKSLA